MARDRGEAWRFLATKLASSATELDLIAKAVASEVHGLPGSVTAPTRMVRFRCHMSALGTSHRPSNGWAG